VLLDKPGEMENIDTTTFNEPGYSNNLAKLSMKKKEKLAARILTTKCHTKPADGLGAGEEIRINPIMKDFIINGYADESYMQAGKDKRSKRRKTKVKSEVVESVGENQSEWIDTLKEEIANLK
jgi:hypothetical protein